MSVSYMLTAQLSGRIANKLGPRVPMTAGMGLVGLGLLMLALIPLNDSHVLIETGLLAIGCGLGLNVGPMNAVAVANVPPARSGTARCALPIITTGASPSSRLTRSWCSPSCRFRRQSWPAG